MNTPNATSQDLKKVMNELGRRARLAARHLATASNDRKSQAISEAAKQILNDESAILKANAQDVAVGMSAKRSEAMLDRLRLDNSRLNAIANSLDLIAELPDPVGQSIAAWKRP
ncbi:MAG: glutamate-5-semialdehyde dehydrogenase, partial [Mariniblastus sp.]